MNEIERAIIAHVERICGKTATMPRLSAFGILKRLGEPTEEAWSDAELEEKLSDVPDNVLDDWRPASG